MSLLAEVAGDPTASLLAPGTIIGTIVGGTLLIVKTWKDGRSIDVESAQARAAEEKERAEREKARADAAEAERDQDVQQVKRELQAVREELEAVREEMVRDRQAHDAQMRERDAAHRREMDAQWRRNEVLVAATWRLREWIVSGQAKDGRLPPDMDPEVPGFVPEMDVLYAPDPQDLAQEVGQQQDAEQDHTGFDPGI